MASPTSSRPEELWYTRCAVPTPLSLAAQFGWLDQEFAPDAIRIRSLRESTDEAEKASHYDHTLPHSFRQGGSVPPIWARANGQETRVVGLSWTDEFQAILTLPASGIRTTRDLRGRRIGLPRHVTRIDHNRASALRAFIVALELDGLRLADVEAVDLPDAAFPTGDGDRRHTYLNEARALAAGEVDAIYVKDVRGLEVARLLGAHVVADLGFHPDPFVRISNCAPRPLTVNAETIERHPELVSRFLARVRSAAAWARRHPDETVSWIARETGWAAPAVRRSYGPDVHLHLDIDLAPEKVDGLHAFTRFLFEHGFVASQIDIAAWIDPRPLAALAGVPVAEHAAPAASLATA
jgi:ABC-type nitrate/sulfonate/bicarbonate transport system substrate-binding protein